MVTQGPDNYDFAGLKINQGPLPARGGDGQATPGEWNRAQRNKVGGKRDRCRRGKSCSATCIAASKDCVVELPEPVQREIRRMAIYLIRKGQTGAEDSGQDRRTGAALLQLGKVTEKGNAGKRSYEKINGKRVKRPDLAFRRQTGSADRQVLSWREVQSLKRRKDLLGNAEFNEQAMKFLQKDAFGRGLRLRKDELEAIYGSFNNKDQTALNRTGAAGKQWWAGKDEKGNDKFSTSGGKERGVAVLDMWFRQGGTDAYRGRNGRVRAPMDYDVEHVKPLAKGGVDSPSNWILARSGSQRSRQNTELGKWIDSLPNSRAEYRDYLRGKLSDKQRGDMQVALLKKMDPSKLTSEQLVKMGGDPLSKLFANEGARSLSAMKIGWYPATGGQRANTGPPAPVVKGLALAMQANRAQGLKLTNDFQKEWNQAITSGQGPKQAFNSLVGQLKSTLPSDQFALLSPYIASWQQKNT